jgi:hypothetical protein
VEIGDKPTLAEENVDEKEEDVDACVQAFLRKQHA